MAPPRTRTLGVTLSVTAISSSKQLTIIFICGYKMLLYHLVVRFQKISTIGHSYLGLQSRDFRFVMNFFSPSPKKKFFFFILIENKFVLIFNLIGKKIFFASPGSFFVNFYSFLIIFFTNFKIIFKWIFAIIFNDFFNTFWWTFLVIFLEFLIMFLQDFLMTFLIIFSIIFSIISDEFFNNF